LLKLTLEHANCFLNVIINNLDFQEQSPHFPTICNPPSCLRANGKISYPQEKSKV
jgi:hypothetical protein